MTNFEKVIYLKIDLMKKYIKQGWSIGYSRSKARISNVEYKYISGLDEELDYLIKEYHEKMGFDKDKFLKSINKNKEVKQ